MKYRIAAWVVLSVVAGLWLAAPAPAKRVKLSQARMFLQDKKGKAQDKKGKAPAAEVDVNKLALEVIALRGLQELDPSLEQLKGLQEMYKPTFASKAELPTGKASKNFINNLRKLRNAYVKNNEDEIEEVSNKVDVLQEEEQPEVIDEVRPSANAFRAAGEALRLFSARQVLEVLNAYDDDLPGPVSTLMEALEDGLDSKGPDWAKESKDAAFQASWLAFGLANPRSVKARADALKWLNEKHSLSKEALERQRSQLEKDVREKIFERVNPADVLRNIILHDMAVILSNPELPGVLVKRIKFETNNLKKK